jgi:3-oxoacyl-[acyl-carrier-protein] synthase II
MKPVGALYVSVRVVVTGLGAVTPLGHTVRESWENIVNGKSGIGWLSLFDTSDFEVKVAGEVRDWNPNDYLPSKEVRRRDRYQLLAHAATMQAFEDAEIQLNGAVDRTRMGICVGSAIGGMTSFSEQLHRIDEGGPRRMAVFGVPSFMTTGASSMASIELDLHGPSYILTSACATGSDCIGHAFDQIRLGRMDMMLAGAGEAPILRNSVAGFDRLGACSHLVDDPTQVMRPFDANRTGLVVSEGAAVLVLESLEAAQARGAEILAEIVGYGTSSDSYHIVAPQPDGRGASIAIQRAMDDAKIESEDLQYINAHGTATALNDTMETYAIKHTLGETAYSIPVSSTKSMTGHAMGASSAMEAIFCVQALRDQVVPPTINFETADPECDLDYVPNVAREMPLTHVMSNAFGFGGHNSVLIFKAFQD